MYETELLQAAVNGRIRDIINFMNQGADIRTVDQNGKNVFHLTAENGNEETLKRLIEWIDDFYMSIAIKNADNFVNGFLISIVEGFSRVEKKTSIMTHSLLDAEDKMGRTPLHYAAANNHIGIINLLLSKKCHIDATDNLGNTPLCLAAFNGKIDAVNFLLKRGADIKPDVLLHKPNDVGCTPLHWAAFRGHLEVLKILFDHCKTKYSATYIINFKSKEGYTPVTLAAFDGHTDVVNYLISNGAHLKAINLYNESLSMYHKNTPLMLAAQQGHVETVKSLLKHDAGLNDQNANGSTALHLAAKNQQCAIIPLLLKAGADINIMNRNGELALNFIEDRKWLNQSLIECGYQAREEFDLKLDDPDQPHHEYALISIMSTHKENRILSQLSEKDLKKHNERENFLFEKGWKLLSTSEELGIKQHCYFGVAYYKINKEKNCAEVVIAHRGTRFDFDQLGNIIADLEILEAREAKILREAAFLYISKVINQEKPFIGNVPVKKITHVGFSLGGYIAAASALLAKGFSNVFAVAFDPPGYSYLEFDEHRANNIINYVTTPNMINTCNEYIGEIRRLSSFPEIPTKNFDRHKIERKVTFKMLNIDLLIETFKTLESHCLENIITYNERLGVLRYQRVFKWSTAINKVIYGERKIKEYYSYPEGGGLLTKMAAISVQYGFEMISGFIWNMTQRTNANGEKEGIIAVEHSRKDLIFYNETSYKGHLLKLKEKEEQEKREFEKFMQAEETKKSGKSEKLPKAASSKYTKVTHSSPDDTDVRKRRDTFSTVTNASIDRSAPLKKSSSLGPSQSSKVKEKIQLFNNIDAINSASSSEKKQTMT